MRESYLGLVAERLPERRNLPVCFTCLFFRLPPLPPPSFPPQRKEKVKQKSVEIEKKTDAHAHTFIHGHLVRQRWG